MAGSDVRVRQASRDDHDAVAAFTESTWSDRDAGDYIPRVFPDWVAGDGPDQRTVVAERDGAVVGVCQGRLLSPHEAWAQGMRVHPDHRGTGVAAALNDDLFAWAADAGAAVCRNMVFSWNVAGLGAARAVGFDPRAEFRWAHPMPDADAAVPEGHSVAGDHARAWASWARSDARDALGGLALDAAESWALTELTPSDLRRAADDQRVVAVRNGDRTEGGTFRVRREERETDEGSTESWAEYGAAWWADATAARAVLAAVARDAAALGVDRTRVLVPETPRHVSDAALAGVAVDDEPDFVLEADLTGR